jgi:hypothetical protein
LCFGDLAELVFAFAKGVLRFCSIIVRRARFEGDEVLRGRQSGATVVVTAWTPPSAGHAFAVLPQNLTAAIRVRTVQGVRHHVSNSGVGLLVTTSGEQKRAFANVSGEYSPH